MRVFFSRVVQSAINIRERVKNSIGDVFPSLEVIWHKKSSSVAGNSWVKSPWTVCIFVLLNSPSGQANSPRGQSGKSAYPLSYAIIARFRTSGRATVPPFNPMISRR